MPTQPYTRKVSPQPIRGRSGLDARRRHPHGERRNKLIRRTGDDYSQALRRAYQFGFLALNAWLGIQFYVWVRHFETAGRTLNVARPPGIEGYLPIAGLMNVRYWLLTGRVPAIHPAAMFLVITFVAMAFLMRTAFCSWLCPVGTFSEFLWKRGRRLFRRNFHLPRGVDLPLRGTKYLLLAFFLWAVGSMSAAEIATFLRSPYGLIADVKMLNFFRFLGLWGAVTLSVFVLASILVQNFWCRYLCPYGALLGLAALVSPVRIKRDRNACIDCARCARACPSSLPVDKLISVKSAECTACLECVAVCPAENALSASLVGTRNRRVLQPWAVAAAIAVVFLGVTAVARGTGHWNTDLPVRLYMQLVPHANEAKHPMPGR